MSADTHTSATSDGRKIQRVIDELRELDSDLQDIQAKCSQKRESGRVKDHKKERARTDWIAEERKTVKLRKEILEAIAGYEAGVVLDELHDNLE
jgi:ribosomal protein L11 methylase PrmA